MVRFFWVCFAGAVGTGIRYLVSIGAARTFGGNFPYGTLLVNVVGCFLIAAIWQMSTRGNLVSPELRVVLTTGFVGGLTTYSAFNFDTTRLLQERPSVGFVNVATTLAACFAAGLLGAFLVRRLGD